MQQPSACTSPSSSIAVRFFKHPVRFLRKRSPVPVFGGPSQSEVLSAPASWSTHWRRSLPVLGLMVFAAHVFILSGGYSCRPTIVLSNLAQTVLGILAVLAMLDAVMRSSHFGRR